jgi:hypothetical protein
MVAACHQDDPAAPAQPEPFQAVQADLEAMIAGALAGWWRSSHGAVPGAALSTAADAHTSSWRNWGMLDAGAEPRRSTVLDPDDSFEIITTPWIELNRTLAAARDVLLAIEGGVQPAGGPGADGTTAFAKLLQGLALGQLAQLFEGAFIVDESTDLSTLELSPYAAVMDGALAKLAEAIALAEGGTFTIPAAWVAFDRPLDQDELARLARSQRARLAISVARSPAERQAVDWGAVLDDVRGGVRRDWGGRYDGVYQENWAWSMDKLFAGSQPMWARMDYRTIGPADASGAYQQWLATPPVSRLPFPIDTDDRRITGATPEADGSYVGWAGDPIFRPERGQDHFSYYVDLRWAHLLDALAVGFHPDFPVKELEYIEAEALYRLGDRAEAMAIVNRRRTAAGLPELTDPAARVPGGARCVPRRADGSCGDLWDALAYEKRIELFHYGAFTEFLDDRGWGDLVPGTFVDFPAPDASYGPLLQKIYGVTPDAAAQLARDVSAPALRAKRLAYDAFDRARNDNPGAVAGR